MPGFTKLHSTLIGSTVWQEDKDTKIAWVTLLALANRNGEVWASVPGLARFAGLTISETEQALAKFLAPDPYSRTSEREGRRVELIEGGWRLLNYEKYRCTPDDEQARENNRIRQQRWRDKQVKPDVTSHNADNAPLRDITLRNTSSRQVTTNNDKAEAEAEAEAEAACSSSLGFSSSDDCIDSSPLLLAPSDKSDRSGSAVFLEIPLIDKTNFRITLEQVAEWRALYLAVDVEQELRNYKGWTLANPTKRKTRRGILTSVNSWLSKTQNHAGENTHGRKLETEAEWRAKTGNFGRDKIS